MRKLLLVSLTISAMLFLFACQGPQGPAGPQGEQGPRGHSSSFDSEMYAACQDALGGISDEGIRMLLEIEDSDLSSEDLQGMVKFMCLTISSGIFAGYPSDWSTLTW